ncbi:MAG: hypothetical protein GY770_14940 [Aestuariibacter sp.]|nr:hypothetical protein [Aestuariibacter sp.]
MKKIIFSIILFCMASPLLADYPLEIIALKSRPVAEMIPLIKPFINKDGSIAGMNHQLIIRTSADNLETIKSLIARFDTPPKRLMIYVRQGTAGNTNNRFQATDINTFVGKNSKIIVGSPGPNNSVRYRTKSTSTQSRHDATHSLQATEGYPAYIQTGQAIPIQELATTTSGGVVQQQVTTRYRNATSGFYVTPRINGQQVTLDISPNADRPGRVQGTFDIQQAHTMVSGRLGEWIAIGGVNQSRTQSNSGITRQARTRSQENRNIEVLVEEIH